MHVQHTFSKGSPIGIWTPGTTLPQFIFVHIPVNGTELTQLLSIRASRFSGLRACISLRNTIYNSQMPSSSFLHGHWQGEPPLFLSSNNEVHESEIRPDKLSRTHRTFGNTLLGFLYNKFDGLDFVRYLPNFMPLSMRPLLPSPTTYPPLYFYIANEIPHTKFQPVVGGGWEKYVPTTQDRPY